MINIVYIDDEMFTTNGSTYDDIHDIWLYNLKDIEANKFELFLYDDPEEFLRKIRELGNNTIVLLDMQMESKGTNGAIVLKSIRDINSTIPVIGYSGNKNNEKNRDLLIPLLENDLFAYVQKVTGYEPELIDAINKAITRFQNNIPLELSVALHEYLERHPKFKDIKVYSTSNGSKISLKEIEDEINHNTLEGLEYAKSLYKMSFEDLVKG